ncbi:MAG TPA: hypothetical protein V6D03_09860, partial [Candidatus Caenarcaniphilales bacterium]
MINKLHHLQELMDATFEPLLGALVPMSYGNDDQAIEAAHQGVALVDRSHWGRLQVSGQDRLAFLHNQSTNNFKQLAPGQGCDTVFVTSTARVIDLTTAYITEDAVILLVSPNRRQKLLGWLDRFIFFGDQVQVADLTESTTTFSLIGPASSTLLQQLNAGEMVGAPSGNHASLTINGLLVRVAVGSGLITEGYTLIAQADEAAALWSTLTKAGAIPMGELCWEQLRIQQGRPKPDQELTEDYNPLEAGLWQTISFDKGCYIGQETIARLHTYQGVKQQLWGIRLSHPAEPG